MNKKVVTVELSEDGEWWSCEELNIKETELDDVVSQIEEAGCEVERCDCNEVWHRDHECYITRGDNGEARKQSEYEMDIFSGHE